MCCVSAAFEVLLLAAACRGMVQGPCPNTPLHTVDLDVTKWPGDMYVNVNTNNPGARCQWVSRRIGYENGTVTIRDHFRRVENGTSYSSEVEGFLVSKGHYVFKKEIAPGTLIKFHAYFLYFDPPNLDCHVVCTDDPLFKDGTPELYCESQYPDALRRNAPIIRMIAQNNNINLKGLMIVDNCNCPNVPYLRGPSSCSNVTAQEYFSLGG